VLTTLAGKGGEAASYQVRIVPKLSLALFAGTCAILVVNGFFRVRREVAFFESDRVRDHETMGRALAAAVTAVWQTDGRAKALATLDTQGRASPRIDIHWHEGADGTEPTTGLVETTEGREWYTYVPVEVDGRREGGIEIIDRAVGEERFAHSTIVDTIASAIAVAVLSAILSFALGQWIVGNPVAELATKARRVGRGDFAGPVVLPRHDELTELAHEMNAMSDNLATTLEQLRHADRLATVGKLASGLAHELGTPLNVVHARAAMIASGETSPDETKESARVVVGATERMTKIIRQLLQFARRKSMTKSAHDVADLCRETLDLLSTLASKRNVKLEMDQKDADTTLSVDPNELQQVVTNLVVNAVQAMTKPGTVTLTVRSTKAAQPADVPGSDSAARSCLCIEVQDEGTGIARDDIPRVFEPFFTTKDVGEGTGLGLAVSYGIIREHGGWITVDSELGRGTTFRVYLPRAT
jgi:two-component system, NtrC family, sensor kinase